MKKIIIFVVVSMFTVLTGCKHEEETVKEVVQTVEWYKEHAPERKEMIAKCNTNPGELAATPNCVNASRASSAITWGAKGGIKVAPLTAEEIKNNKI